MEARDRAERLEKARLSPKINIDYLHCYLYYIISYLVPRPLPPAPVEQDTMTIPPVEEVGRPPPSKRRTASSVGLMAHMI